MSLLTMTKVFRDGNYILTKKCVKLKFSELEISFLICDFSLDRFYFPHLPYIVLKRSQESSQFLLDTLSWIYKTDGEGYTQRSYCQFRVPNASTACKSWSKHQTKIKFVTDEIDENFKENVNCDWKLWNWSKIKKSLDKESSKPKVRLRSYYVFIYKNFISIFDHLKSFKLIWFSIPIFKWNLKVCR